MFKVDLSETYFFPVEYEMPIDGKFVKSSFDGEFKRVGGSELKELHKNLNSSKEENENAISVEELLSIIFVGWRKIIDTSGKPFVYADETRAILLEMQGMDGAIVRAWTKALSGSGGEKTKN